MLALDKRRENMQKFYKFKHNNLEVNKKSSSGGAFTLLSNKIFEKGGIVYGCVLDDEFNAIHIRAENKEIRNKMRGSKYIQSNILKSFDLVASDLKECHKVLFSGTPCQINAMLNYLKQKKISTKELITVEVICHGVGSSRFFHDYVKDKEKKEKSKAVDVCFRSKYRTGQKQDMSIKFKNGKAYHAASTNLDWFYSIYLKNLILRPSCYKCKFAKQDRIADISIADYWEKDETEDYSLIICNTDKGGRLLTNKIDGEFVEINKAKVHQPHMNAPCNKPIDRKQFWKVYLYQGYEEVQKKWGNNTLKGRIKYMMAEILQILHITGIVKKMMKRAKND